MNKVLTIRKEDMDITLQPSVGYDELNEVLEKDGMFFRRIQGRARRWAG
jgi:D-lactate dehydrogenase (cytochrome)